MLRTKGFFIIFSILTHRKIFSDQFSCSTQWVLSLPRPHTFSCLVIFFYITIKYCFLCSFLLLVFALRCGDDCYLSCCFFAYTFRISIPSMNSSDAKNSRQAEWVSERSLVRGSSWEDCKIAIVCREYETRMELLFATFLQWDELYCYFYYVFSRLVFWILNSLVLYTKWNFNFISLLSSWSFLFCCV